VKGDSYKKVSILMTIITAPMFCEAFISQWNEDDTRQHAEIMRQFADFTSRTTFMLLPEPDGFMKRVMQKLNRHCELEFLTEQYKVDAVYYFGKEKYDDVSVSGVQQAFVLIEHENGSFVEEEMWKLMHWSCPLKVIVFYDYDAENVLCGGTYASFLPNKIRKLNDMVNLKNANFQENPQTEYLLIVGQLERRTGLVSWRFSTRTASIGTTFCNPRLLQSAKRT
jgi:hypothetical protein